MRARGMLPVLSPSTIWSTLIAKVTLENTEWRWQIHTTETPSHSLWESCQDPHGPGAAPSGEQVGAGNGGKGGVAVAPGGVSVRGCYSLSGNPMSSFSSGPDTSTNVARRGKSKVQLREGLLAPPKPPGSHRAPANPGERGWDTPQIVGAKHSSEANRA